jgi:para-nitrobenzyl esterase
MGDACLAFSWKPAFNIESPHHISGNDGMLCLVAALTWVKHNIATFGCDPKCVTITG